MKTCSRIFSLFNYRIVLIILCAPIGFGEKKTNFVQTNKLHVLSTSSVTDLHPNTSNNSTSSSQQADSATVENQSSNFRTPGSENTEKSSASIPTKDVELAGQEIYHTSPVSLSTPSTPTSTSTSINPPISTLSAISSSKISSVIVSSAVVNRSSSHDENYDTSTVQTLPAHRKSKPEGTHVDDEVRDSGPTADYVVPLVIAMLAVPLVGVLCALLYLKGRDFWERRHYGRIDILWDNRNDSRMDFLIDGMYNN